MIRKALPKTWSTIKGAPKSKLNASPKKEGTTPYDISSSPGANIAPTTKKSKDGKKIMSLKLRNWSFRNQILAQGKFGSDTYGRWVPA